MGQGKKSQARASPLGPACLPSRPGHVGEAAGRSQGRVGRRLAAPPPDARALSGRQALQCIKRKKMYEGQVEKIGQARLNLETQQLALEQLNLNKEVVEAQREGAKTMASVTAQMGEWLSACALRAVCPVPRVRDMSPRHVRDMSPQRVLD